MEKLTRLAIALGIILAIVAGVIPMGNFNAGLTILILGVIGGVSAPQENAMRMFIAVLALPVIATALAAIPTVGNPLAAIFNNIQLAAAGASASLVARRVFEMVMDSFTSLTAK